MNDEHIDLGVSSEELYGDMKAIAQAPGEPEPKKIYPVIHYSGPVELDLPQEGMMEIGFFKKSETSKVDPKTGKHWYECDIEVRCICEVEGEEEPDEPTHRDRSAEEALDKLAEAVSKRNGNRENSGY